MYKFIRFYLYILPFFSLVGIVLSTFRTTHQIDSGLIFLLISAIFDSIIVFLGRKSILNKTMGLLLTLLTLSLLMGLINGNELSRRFITDFTNPFFFFAKIYIFAKYWNYVSFSKYIKYYTRVAFWGSLILLPLTYAIFSKSGITRLSIFPPMELPLANFMQSNTFFFIISFIIILLYGKRAQFGGALVTLIFFIFVFKRSEIIKYSLLLIVFIFSLNIILTKYSDNISIRRLVGTFDNFNESGGGTDGVEKVAGGRKAEVDAIMTEMNTIPDYLFGKGMGYTYVLNFFTVNKKISNAHFSPISFLSKYGLLFTLFFYWFIISKIFVIKKSLLTSSYITAVSVCIFVFFESFFAYAFFVTPIVTINLGYLINQQNLKLRK